jgi:hypothetical protein
VLTQAPPDYSARREAALLRGGHSGLHPVLRTPHLTVFSVPNPTPILTGTAPAKVVKLYGERVIVSLARPGRYRLAVRYSPYWHAEGACLSRNADGMISIASPRGGRFELSFQVNAAGALAAVVGKSSPTCDDR